MKVNNYAGDALQKNRDFKGYAAERSAAVRAHLKAGFTIYQRENGIIRLLISREQYIK
ncbi:hypothetical protein [Acetatifactor muris]|uniref:hypothetical protein n=1 Tax=Acetatifactor muris TaxID=879566 RepID=UPI0023F30EE0|nr:hypothetical protein [Acetatifactor muris]